MESAFQLIAGKVMRFDVSQVLQFAGSDLMAYVTDQDAVVVKRIADKPQKIGVAEMDDHPTSICSGRSGRLLLIGTATGHLRLFSISSSKLIETCCIQLGPASIRLVGWQTFGGKVRPLKLHEDSLIVKSYSSPIIETIGEAAGSLSIAWGLVDRLSIVLLAQGLFPVADLFLGTGLSVLDISAFDDWNQLFVLCSETQGVSLRRFDVTVIADHAEEICNLTLIVENAAEMMRVMAGNVKQAVHDWHSVSQLFHVKFTAGIQTALESVQLHSSVQEVLLQTIATGMSNAGLTQFLKNDIHSFKALVQFDERVRLQTGNLTKVVLDGVLHIAQRLTVLWSKLRGFSRYPEGYGVFGLDEGTISALIACNGYTDASNIQYVAYALLAALERSNAHMHNFVLWMNYCEK